MISMVISSHYWCTFGQVRVEKKGRNHRDIPPRLRRSTRRRDSRHVENVRPGGLEPERKLPGGSCTGTPTQPTPGYAAHVHALAIGEAAQIRTRSKAEDSALRRPGSPARRDKPAGHASPAAARLPAGRSRRATGRSRGFSANDPRVGRPCDLALGRWWPEGERFWAGAEGSSRISGELEVSAGLDAAALDCTSGARHTRVAYERAGSSGGVAHACSGSADVPWSDASA
ncbi:hypothetical protein C2845_PM08G29750 [Panicum miliaceum]|uniref:Uncharacterized protein n=1 Tax=Panicum miliaceum TaxID=4540 RepID=A0A3L6QXL0_PANMI|nr:hypothetical protein C2845_PM08G29750 [Panicum miliaceum]